MPIRTQSDLPAKEILEQENIFVMDESRAMHQDIRPINIVILNLMPLKEETELQIFRSLSNTPLQVDVSLLAPASHASTHTSKSHLNKFYQTFQEIKNQYFDGLIITGAPVEQMKYEEVDYWDEVCEIMEWSKKHVTSTLHLCWGAQAALYYHYGIQKYDLKQKMFGVFRHHVMNRKIPMVRGFDDYFYAPHSRLYLRLYFCFVSIQNILIADIFDGCFRKFEYARTCADKDQTCRYDNSCKNYGQSG